MLSLSSAHPPLHSSKLPLLGTKIPKSKIDPSARSLGYSRNGDPLHSKPRFFAKSTRTEGDASQSAAQPQISQEKPTSSTSGGSPASSFLSLLCPLLRFFGGRDPSQERNEFIEITTSSLSSLARFPWGSKPLTGRAHDVDSTKDLQPHLQLYEFEACPFCRRVREAMTELDLSAEVYPCPKGSLIHREKVRKMGDKEQFPFLVDLRTGVSMYESGDIVKYLFEHYGQGRKPTFGLLESTLFTGWVPTLLRAGRGMTLWDKAAQKPPPKRLELFSYENNPYARIIREALCELELPYILHNVGEGSSKTEFLIKSSGSKEVPYLIDPNTGVQMGDYMKILSYLFQTYESGD